MKTASDDVNPGGPSLFGGSGRLAKDIFDDDDDDDVVKQDSTGFRSDGSWRCPNRS